MQNQWGFLPGKLTTSAILSATHDRFTLLEKGKEVGAVFLDLTKAFDSVPHRQLIAKLEAIGLNAYLINWIKNYLAHRTQYVMLNGVSSLPLPVLSVLGPLSMTSVMQESLIDPNLFYMQATSSCIGLSTLWTTVLCCNMMLIPWPHGAPPNCSSSIQLNARLNASFSQRVKED